ncbi:response regulator [Oligoflexia bacterium]|nr:response regulator [Oligoflexia bacterium]
MIDTLKLPKVFIVDDEPKVLKAISQTVKTLDCNVRCFQSVAECIEGLKQSSCDLLITDVNMPGMDGLQLLQEARKIQPLMPVLVMTGYANIPMAVKAVKYGAFDFIEKPLDEGTFLPLVQSALTRSQSDQPLKGKSLTKAEQKVLKLVAEGKSNKEIAHLLERSIRTVENHRHRLMQKLEAGSTAELVKIAIAIGLTSSEGDE